MRLEFKRSNYSAICIALLVAFIVFSVPAHAKDQKWEWPKLFTVAFGVLGGPAYSINAAWAPVLEEDTGMRVRLVSESSKALQDRWVKQGKYHITGDPLTAVADPIMTGRGGYIGRDGGPYQRRLVWHIGALAFGHFVRGDSDIKTPADIKPGTKCSYSLKSIGISNAMDALLAWGGVKKEDIVQVPFSRTSAACKALIEGRVDIVYTSCGAPGVFEAAGGPHGIRWLETDPTKEPEAAARGLKVKPNWIFGQVPKGLGEPSASGKHLSIMNVVLFTRAEMDDDLAYHLTKWFHKNFDKYKGKHRTLISANMETFEKILDITPMPVHDGTKRYLQEIGLWNEAREARQKANIQLIDKYIEAYEGAIKLADSKGVDVKPENPEWAKLWDNYKESHNIPPVRVGH